MTTAISIDRKPNIFNQLFAELKFALNDLTSRELMEILLEASGESIKTTYQSKKKSIANLSDLSKKFINCGKQKVVLYKTIGVKESVINDLKRAGSVTSTIPTKLKDFCYNFRSYPREKQIEIIASTMLLTAIYLGCCGGLDVEGGLPDLDISIAGIGHHRSIFSHSIILGLGVEFSARLIFLILGKIRGRLPYNHHRVWDKTFDYIDKNKEKAIMAMWLGISTHLIKDSGIITGGFKSYADIPFYMNKETHQATFFINGLTSGVFSNTKNHL